MINDILNKIESAYDVRKRVEENILQQKEKSVKELFSAALDSITSASARNEMCCKVEVPRNVTQKIIEMLIDELEKKGYCVNYLLTSPTTVIKISWREASATILKREPF